MIVTVEALHKHCTSEAHRLSSCVSCLTTVSVTSRYCKSNSPMIFKHGRRLLEELMRLFYEVFCVSTCSPTCWSLNVHLVTWVIQQFPNVWVKRCTMLICAHQWSVEEWVASMSSSCRIWNSMGDVTKHFHGHTTASAFFLWRPALETHYTCVTLVWNYWSRRHHVHIWWSLRILSYTSRPCHLSSDDISRVKTITIDFRQIFADAWSDYLPCYHPVFHKHLMNLDY